MRKLFLAAALAATVSGAYAQKLEDVQEKISKGKYDEAKEKLDKVFADPKNAKNANAYYYKGVINNYFAQTDSAGTLPYDAATEAFIAYKKTLEIDPKNPLMTIDQNMGLFQLFDLHYNKAIRQYNNKKYDDAFSTFKKAVDVQDYIKSKNFSLPTYTPPVLDTQLLNLTASSAYLAKQEDVAIPYFERLANAKVKDPEFKEVYALLAQYYLKKNDQANASKYLAMGKELYPDEDYWLSLEFGNVGDNKEAKLKRYEEMVQKYPNNGTLAMDYAIELFNNTYVWDKKPADYTARQAKLQAVLDKAVPLNENNGITYFILSQHTYSQIFDLEDERRAIKGNTAAEAAKRKDLNARIDKKYDEMMAASQKAFDIYSAKPDLKSQDKVSYRKVTDQLIDYYTRKKMNDKVTFYQNKKTAMK
jgi:tetratricopeptide (TPR) repeat protein